MKKYFILFAAICAAVAVSCTPKELAIDTPAEEGVSDVKLIPITITASLEGTKADMVDVKWTWQSGDKLAVYDGTEKREFTLDESAAGTAVAKFTGEVAETFTSLQAVFPYDAAGATFDTPIIPAKQTIPSGATIDPAAMIAIAETAVKVSDDEFNFYFTSGVSMLRFTVPDGVQKVILHTEGKEATIAGESRSVTVNVPGAGQYWAAVNPAAYEGMKVFARTSNGDFLKSTASTIDLSAPGKAKNLGNLGTGNKVAVIENGDQLTTPANLAGLDVYVVNDLDLSGVNLTPITSFSNTLDGLYHIISNWSASNALFAKNAGTIQNLIIDKTCSINLTSAISSSLGIAFIVSNSHTGLVKNCEVAGAITINSSSAGKFYCAGIVGEATTGTVESCKFSGSIDVTLTNNSASCSAIAGIVGRFGKKTDTAEKVMISNCENTGSIKFLFSGATEQMKKFGIGGIAGQSVSVASATDDYGIIENCINRGDIEWRYPAGGKGSYPALGGVVGLIEGQLKSCNNYGKVSYYGGTDAAATDASIGGVAGYVTLGASDCHNYGELVVDAGLAGGTSLAQSGGNTSFTTIGGVFGNAGPYAADNTNCASKGILVENCSNEKGFTIKPYMIASGGPEMCFGGVIGASTANMKNCQNKGDIVFESQTKTINAGGIVGFLEANMEDCTNSGSVTIKGASASHPTSVTVQAYFGGILGQVTKGSVIKNVKNTGDVTIEDMYSYGDPSNSTYNILSYIGGIMGTYKGGITLNGAENTGAVTNKCDIPVVLGGIGGALNGTLSNLKNSGAVTNQSSYYSTIVGKEPEVGGLAGYSYGNYTNCENTGNITNNAAGGFSGGIVGGYNSDKDQTSNWNSCKVDCSINGSATAGAFLGRFRYNSASDPKYYYATINAGVDGAMEVCGGAASLPLVGNINGDHVFNCVNLIVNGVPTIVDGEPAN